MGCTQQEERELRKYWFVVSTRNVSRGKERLLMVLCGSVTDKTTGVSLREQRDQRSVVSLPSSLQYIF